MRTALVLGGGGITGIAWEVGVLKGLQEGGVDVTDADEILGTSAGSVVGVLARTHPLEDIYAGQLDPPDHRLGGRFSTPGMLRSLPIAVAPGSPLTRRRRIGRAAMRAHPPGGQERVDLIRERIQVDDWPEQLVRITAMSAETGEVRVFDRTSGVDVVRAVAASCAVPFVWPAVSIGDEHYLDGGIRSTTNSDLINPADRCLVIAPLPFATSRYHRIRTQLTRAPVGRHLVIAPDRSAKEAMGRNMLSPARQADAARAGLRQGRGLATRVRTRWPQ